MLTMIDAVSIIQSKDCCCSLAADSQSDTTNAYSHGVVTAAALSALFLGLHGGEGSRAGTGGGRFAAAVTAAAVAGAVAVSAIAGAELV
jgi:hypothetical protein